MIETVKIECPSDVLDEILSADLKIEDKREVEASTGASSSLGLLMSIITSDEAWCLRVDGKAVAWWGCMQVSKNVGAPWFLSTDIVWEMPTVLLRNALQFIKRQPYETLLAAVWTENKEAYRLLEILGFEKAPFIIRHNCPKTPFQCFARSHPCVSQHL